jgi:hypothetical protein
MQMNPNDPEAIKAARARFKKQVFGGEFRWLWTFLLVVCAGFALFVRQAGDRAVLYHPVHLEGHTLFVLIVIVTIVYAVLALVSWFSWLRKASNTH